MNPARPPDDSTTPGSTTRGSTTRRRRAGLTSAVAAAAALLLLSGMPAPTASASATCPAGSTMNIVAHEDDDLLFLSPDLLGDIQAGRCVRTVYLTAGDAGSVGDWYWQARETGIRNAYAQMIGVGGAWTQSDAGVAGHPIPVFTHTGNDRVSLAFLRLPDGLDGNGSEVHGWQSLRRLWENTLPTITTVDGGTSSYTRSQLISALTALMASYAPDQIRTQDFLGAYDDGDHNDHYSTAYFVQAAHAGYPAATLTGYLGYRTRFYPVNVTGAALTGKQNAFYTYGQMDSGACSSPASCSGHVYEAWLQRQYRLNGTNLAPAATATASSQDAGTSQTADKAVDGAIDGYGVPYAGDHTKEWATVGGVAGSWLRLTWPTPRTIGTIVLYDRPNLNDHITAATLTFSGGAPVSVPALDNSGVAKVITLNPPRTVSWVELRVDAVGGNTFNVGLAEFEAYPGNGP